MSVPHELSAFQAIEQQHVVSGRSLSERLLRRMLRGMACGQLIVETPVGEQLVFCGAKPGPQARIALHRWRCLWRLALGSEVAFAAAYIAGDWSSPDLEALLTLASRNPAIGAPVQLLRLPPIWDRLRHALRRNTRRGSRRNILFHYDLGNEFYRLWLDRGMNYSAALFSSPHETLEDAQTAKLDRVLDLLAVAHGDRVLEIGFGWGSMAERLLRRSECHLTGLTLSTEQLAFTRQRLRDHPLADEADLRLQDYRDVGGTFDRIVSIEMLEAVGVAYWSTFFDMLHARLRPGGIAVLQVITIDEARYEAYRRRPDFIQKFVFPGGMLPTPRIIEREAARAGLRATAETFFGGGYARTLQEWQMRFQAAWPQIEALGFDRRFKRTWEYYLAYCRAGFECGALQVGLYQLTR